MIKQTKIITSPLVWQEFDFIGSTGNLDAVWTYVGTINSKTLYFVVHKGGVNFELDHIERDAFIAAQMNHQLVVSRAKKVNKMKVQAPTHHIDPKTHELKALGECPIKEPQVGEVWLTPIWGKGDTEVVITGINKIAADAFVLIETLEGDKGTLALDLWNNYTKRGIHKFLPMAEANPTKTTGVDEQIKHSHYFKQVTGYEHIDIYRLLRLWGVVDHEIGHAVKKLLNAGQRGAKDKRQDLKEAIDTLQRMIAILEEDEALGATNDK